MGTYLGVIQTGLVLGTCFVTTSLVSKIVWASLSDQIRFIIVGSNFPLLLACIHLHVPLQQSRNRYVDVAAGPTWIWEVNVLSLPYKPIHGLPQHI